MDEGTWKADIYVDGSLVATRNFVIKRLQIDVTIKNTGQSYFDNFYAQLYLGNVENIDYKEWWLKRFPMLNINQTGTITFYRAFPDNMPGGWYDYHMIIRKTSDPAMPDSNIVADSGWVARVANIY